jgi:hypothetical protein
MPHFWEGGADAYGRALRQEYELARERLEASLKQCADPLEQQTVKEELEKLKQDFQRKRAGVGRSLFGAQ